MANGQSFSKIAFKVGAVSFSAEGDPAWCEKQLGAVLAATSRALPDFSSTPAARDPVIAITEALAAPAMDEPSDFSLTLTNYLKARAGSNQRLNASDGKLNRVRARD